MTAAPSSLPTASSVPSAPHPTGRLDFHPYVEIFPPMGKKALMGLAEDIASNGLTDPIVLITDTDDDGTPRTRILDGRHRYLACQETRQPDTFLRFVDFNEIAGPDADPLRWVRSKNLKRRQLTRNQRADAAARWTEIFEDRARVARQAAAAKTNTQRWGTEAEADSASPPSSDSDPQQTLPGTPPPTGRTRDIAAKEFGTSPTAVQTTRRIRRDGVEDLADLHRDGMLTTKTAGDIARLPEAQQRDILDAVREADEPCEAKRLAREQLDRVLEQQRKEKASSTVTELPTPTTEASTDASSSSPTNPSPDTSQTSPTAGTSFYALPDRGEVRISRNALEVLLAVVEGAHDHPHRDQALAAIHIQLQHDVWGAA